MGLAQKWAAMAHAKAGSLRASGFGGLLKRKRHRR
jgi:hypothetical protein